eukprot:6233615-Prorocentrum_lima.AAC.1
MTVDASRGRTAPMVYVLRHPRTVDTPSIDQHHGIQGDISPRVCQLHASLAPLLHLVGKAGSAGAARERQVREDGVGKTL